MQLFERLKFEEASQQFGSHGKIYTGLLLMYAYVENVCAEGTLAYVEISKFMAFFKP